MNTIAPLLAERSRQDTLWGTQNHNPEKWLAILAEEFGECAKDVCDSRYVNLRTELIQTAAVCIAFAESLDRNELKEKY